MNEPTPKDRDKAEEGCGCASGLPSNFIREIVAEDVRTGKNGGKVMTRFPPEPNGYLHIGHAKSICLNFGLAKEFGGVCNLRFDDTNPAKEEVEYVESIQEDVHWLGFDWGDHRYYASNYFDFIYSCAEKLITMGKAYVDDQSADQIRENRGTLTKPGTNSPYRDRSVEENLDLFRRMRAGEFAEGSRILRAKIDMTHANICMRDPAIYRIKKATHHRTGDKWCIYPMYDFAHCLSDASEGVTHSVCTLEFENNRQLYDWVLDTLATPCHPQQIEFARLNMTYVVLSKRKLIQLVREGVVDGWDDPRMPTISGYRRRGYTPESIRTFCEKIGVARSENLVDIALLESCLRDDLNERAPRVMAVLNPIKVTIENYPEGQVEWFEFPNHPEKPELGKRQVPFSRTLFIEREDFREVPPRKFHRLFPGGEVRLRYAYYITCTKVVKDERGEITELVCTYDPATKGGWSQDGRKVKGTLHWVSAAHAVPAEVRLYDRLFSKENPDDAPEGKTYLDNINPNSLEIITAQVEPSLKDASPMDRFQFERMGYFCVDTKHSAPGKPVFNRIVGLKDSWAKIEKKGQ